MQLQSYKGENSFFTETCPEILPSWKTLKMFLTDSLSLKQKVKFKFKVGNIEVEVEV